MNCTRCNKNHAGYRCPYCGNFELNDIELHNRHATSIYAKKRKKVDRANKVSAVFWLFFIILFLAIIVLCTR